jgi:hypothetical protein
LQELIAAVEERFLDLLLHARIVEIALSGRFLLKHFQDAVALGHIDDG